MRETRAADSQTWGAMSVTTNVDSPKLDDELPRALPVQVIHFPSKELEEDSLLSSEDREGIQSLFSRKSKERRRRDEPNK